MQGNHRGTSVCLETERKTRARNKKELYVANTLAVVWKQSTQGTGQQTQVLIQNGASLI